MIAPMKQQFIFGLAVLLLLVLVPLVGLLGNPAAPVQEETSQTIPVQQQEEPETIQVIRAASGKTETVALREYLIGCAAAEMEAGSHLEALKAQVVAGYTYARYRQEVGGRQTLSDSGASDQSFFDAGQRKQRWGDQFDHYEAKIAQAVDAVLGQTIIFEGQPIFAAYSALSAGATESAAVYWGSDYPYLQSVESPGDKLAPDYKKTTILSLEDVKKALEKTEDVKLGEDPADWFGKPERSPAGTVTAITAGGRVFSGRELREALGLRSANFTIEYKDKAFAIQCLGYGHGVGMSQYGADFMARQGSGYQEILAHYYTGCEIK